MTREPRALPLLLLAIASGCGGPQSVLDAHGASAEHLRTLILGIVAVCSVVWAAVMIVLIWALVRRRPDSPAVSPAVERKMKRAVIASVAATVIVISGFTAASFITTRALSAAAPPDVDILVRGQQWWWQLTYLDPASAKTFQTANEIRIPVGRSVRLQLESPDVIHSFWVPSLAGKLDLIPGRTNVLTIRADRPGTYRGQCAEFCGLQHGHMAFVVIAETPESFDQWRERQRQDGLPPPSAEAAAGAEVFLRKPCAACHTVRGTPATGTSGPDLTHVAGRQTIGAGLFDTTRGTLAAWIADPQTVKPGNNMPLVPLSPDELRQVSAYMASLR